MARTAQATSRTRHKNQIAAASKPKGPSRWRELSGPSQTSYRHHCDLIAERGMTIYLTVTLTTSDTIACSIGSKRSE